MCNREKETGEEWDQAVHDQESGIVLEQSTVYTANHLEDAVECVPKKKNSSYLHAYVMSIDVQLHLKNKLEKLTTEKSEKLSRIIDICMLRIRGIGTKAQAQGETDVYAHDGQQQEDLGTKPSCDDIGTLITLLLLLMNGPVDV